MAMAFARHFVERELARWEREDQKAVLWWRDDDARVRTPELELLLVLSETHQAPVTLSVLPTDQAEGLAPLLRGSPLATVVQYGVDGQDRGGMGPPAEFPEAWPMERIVERLAGTWQKLSALPGAYKAFVPAWNAVHPELASSLTYHGYQGVSASGQFAACAHPPRLDVHVDVLHGRDGPRFRGPDAVFEAFGRELSLRRRLGLWDQPIGILTHHMAHDEGAWRFLGRFLAMTSSHPALTWAPFTPLLQRSAGRGSRLARLAVQTRRLALA